MGTVLIVEDDVSTCEMLVRMVARVNCPSHCTASAGQALLYLEQALPAAILLDLRLPDADGSIILRRVRRDQLPIKVAVVTGAANLPPAVVTLAPDAVFSKPVNLPQLSKWVKDACVA